MAYFQAESISQKRLDHQADLFRALLDRKSLQFVSGGVLNFGVDIEPIVLDPTWTSRQLVVLNIECVFDQALGSPIHYRKTTAAVLNEHAVDCGMIGFYGGNFEGKSILRSDWTRR